MMSASDTTHSSTVLFVFNGQDEPLCRCCQTLSDGGVQVYYVPDVYSATAQLAQGLAPSHVVVDIRLLDNYEMGFLSIAPHYYPNTEILVPLLEGTAERAAHLNGHVETVPLQDLADGILGIRRAVTASSEDDEVVEWAGEGLDDPVTPATSHGQRGSQTFDDGHGAFESPTRASALSTDGGTESTESGLSLHEIVRQRMAGRQPSRIPRRPPQSAPPADSSSPPPSAVSPEEMEALLREGDETRAPGVELPPSDRAGDGAQ